MKKAINSLSVLFFILSGFIAYQALRIPVGPVVSQNIISNPIQKKSLADSKDVDKQLAEPIEKKSLSVPEVHAENTINPVSADQETSPPASDEQVGPLFTHSQNETVSKKGNSPPPAESDRIETVERVLVVLGQGVFLAGQTIIQENLLDAVEAILPHIPADSNYHLIVEGHTSSFHARSPDGIGYLNNNELSAFRAQAVAERLTEQGIPTDRISVIGYGDARPVTSNDSYEGRVKNRRVEVKLITWIKV